MTRIILLLIALGIAAPVYADVSDSGNLTIGGTGIIQGTMTVQGNAFSVGGATFAVLSGTVQVGGLLRVSNLGIQWSDGTVSTIAASGGGAGNVILTATQTFSGANTFTATTTIAGGATFYMAPNSIFMSNNVIHISSTASNFTAVTVGSGYYESAFSTVCITLPTAMRMRVWYSGSVEATVSGGTPAEGYIIDGAFDTGFNRQTYIVKVYTVGSGAAPANGSFSWITSQQSAGRHCVGYALWSPGSGLAHACASVTGGGGTSTSNCQFGVEAVP